MRAFTMLLAVSAAALSALVSARAASAQEICLYGGPDAASDLACGPAWVAQPRNDVARSAPSPRASAAAESRLTSGASRTNAAAQSRILAGGRVGPAAPALPTGYALAPPPSETWPAYAPDPAYAYGPEPGYADAPQAAPPPPPFESYVSVEGAGPAPGAFAYAYESADGGAFAWRYDTPQGPAWAYAYETPDGWAYAYAWDAAPEGPPPAVIEAGPGPHGGAYRGPYVAHADEHHAVGADWRYSEARLFGAAYRQQLYLVQTYYRESEWVAVSAIPGRRYLCGGCVAGGPVAAPYAVPYAVPAQRGGFFASGGGGSAPGFGAAGSFLVGGGGSGGATSRASQSFAVMNSASQTMQAQATATGNQNVTAGTPFAPPPGAVPPWGPPAQISGGNTANAFAGAGAASAAAGSVSARAGGR